MTAEDISLARPIISVIIPARNEEANLGDCLESLVTQTGVSFEIIVVDDHSTDRTREIAESFVAHEADTIPAAPDADVKPRTPSSGVAREARNPSPPNSGLTNIRVIEADPLPTNWTGKNNAVTTGSRAARGEWLLFTDADTVHVPGSLARALAEANENNADMLSYSPEQIAVTFCEMAILPVVFAELARQYPPSKVSDPNSPIAAANGQYILIRREAYDAVGGHAAVASEILEDVALARNVKASGRKLRFRYAVDAVRTRMYRNFSQLREGWTKNLALLFPNPGELAVQEFVFFVATVAISWVMLRVTLTGKLYLIFTMSPAALSALSFLYLLVHLFLLLRRAHFSWKASSLILFGLPMFSYLLLRSKRAHGKGTVSWKGRTYAGEAPSEKVTPINAPPSSRTAGKLS
jgi:glycosyltransferase involved in cell wall biosynthesis